MAGEGEAEDRTEAATAHKLEAARLRGDFPDAGPLVASLGLLGAAILLLQGGPALGRGMTGALARGLERAGDASVPVLDRALEGGAGLLGALAAVLSPFLVLAVLLVLVLAVLRRGLTLEWSRLAPDFGRWGPGEAFAPAAWRRRLRRAALAAVRLVALGAAAWMSRPDAERLGAAWAGGDLREALAAGWGALARLLLRATAALAAIGLIEHLLEVRSHHQRLRMSRREVIEEAREIDGDAGLKRRRLRLWRSRVASRAGGEA